MTSNIFTVGSVVKRKPADRGVMWFGLPENTYGTIIDIDIDNQVAYIRGYGDWPHALITLE